MNTPRGNDRTPILTPRLRLILASVAFAAWIGFLAYLAATTTNPVVLARPQFLVSELDVVAEIVETGEEPGPDPKVKITEVLWAKDDKDISLTDKTITVPNLILVNKSTGWTGPGQYILALYKRRTAKGPEYLITPIARSPGYPTPGDADADGKHGLGRIYPATPDARQQHEKIRSGVWD